MIILIELYSIDYFCIDSDHLTNFSHPMKASTRDVFKDTASIAAAADRMGVVSLSRFSEIIVVIGTSRNGEVEEEIVWVGSWVGSWIDIITRRRQRRGRNDPTTTTTEDD